MRLLLTITLSLMTLLAAPTQGRAEFIYAFGFNSFAPSDKFTLLAGSSKVDVQIYLQELQNGMLLQNEKLFSSGVTLAWDNAVLSLTSITPNSLFDFTASTFDNTNRTARLTVGVLLNDLVSPDENNRVLLGDFAFAISGPATIKLTAMDSAETEDTLTGSETLLDDRITDGTATLTVEGESVVPAPPAVVLALIGMGCCGAASWLQKRRGRHDKPDPLKFA